MSNIYIRTLVFILICKAILLLAAILYYGTWLGFRLNYINFVWLILLGPITEEVLRRWGLKHVFKPNINIDTLWPVAFFGFVWFTTEALSRGGVENLAKISFFSVPYVGLFEQLFGQVSLTLLMFKKPNFIPKYNFAFVVSLHILHNFTMGFSHIPQEYHEYIRLFWFVTFALICWLYFSKELVKTKSISDEH